MNDTVVLVFAAIWPALTFGAVFGMFRLFGVKF